MTTRQERDPLLASRLAGETLVDAAARLGCTREEIRRRENAALWAEYKKVNGETKS